MMPPSFLATITITTTVLFCCLALFITFTLSFWDITLSVFLPFSAGKREEDFAILTNFIVWLLSFKLVFNVKFCLLVKYVIVRL